MHSIRYLKYTFYTKTVTVPEQLNPSPVKPLLHVHLYDPAVLLQDAYELQLFET